MLRYEEHIAQKKQKARSENAKPREVAFLMQVENQDKKFTLDAKLEETMRRKLSILDAMRKKQMQQRTQKEELVEKKRLEREQDMIQKRI